LKSHNVLNNALDLFLEHVVKVLSIYYKHKEGGFNKRLYRMFMALANAGHEVHYLSCEPFPIEHDNLKWHPLRIPFSKKESWFFWFCFLLFSPLAILRTCVHTGAARIVVFGSWYSAFAVLARLFLQKKNIVFVRADSVELYKSEARSRIAKVMNYFIDYIGLFVADEIWTNINLVRKNLIRRYRINESKIKVIYNNIDKKENITPDERDNYRNNLRISKSSYVIATSGIFYKRKNIEFLIHAFAEAELNSKAVLLIIGDDVAQGTEGVKLKQLSETLGVSDSVIFTGWRTDSTKIIGASDLYVLPTMHEGFPNSLLDALSVGCPCLGSDIDEIREILKFDELLFDISNTKELSLKLNRLAHDKEHYATVKKLSGSRAEEFCFDWNKYMVNIITA
jgi:glycosyltransferase involved in cell wall biosynthesis